MLDHHNLPAHWVVQEHKMPPLEPAKPPEPGFVLLWVLFVLATFGALAMYCHYRAEDPIPTMDYSMHTAGDR